LDRLTLSADLFIISVDGAIAVPNHNSVYQQCVDAQYNPLVGSAPGSVTGAEMAAGSPTCALIEREYIPGVAPYGAPRRFKAQTINQGGIKTKGIDIQLDWGADFADMGALSMIPGSFSVNILASYLDKYAESAFPGAAFIDYTGSMYNNSYDYQLLSTFNYTNGPLYVGLRWQHLPGMDTPPGSGTAALGVKSHDQLDLFGRWNFNERYTIRAGIDNLLNADPEVVGASTTNNALGTTSSSYNQIGRNFYFGLNASF
jgi:outer membrane receptor protein involved in Fe transport